MQDRRKRDRQRERRAERTRDRETTRINSMLVMNALLRNRNLIPLSSSSSSFTLLSLLLTTLSFLPSTSHTSLSIYLPVSVCISLTLHISFPSLSLIVCHLCDQWSSFFSGNSPMMDFSLLCWACAVFLFIFFGGGMQFASVDKSFE